MQLILVQARLSSDTAKQCTVISALHIATTLHAITVPTHVPLLQIPHTAAEYKMLTNIPTRLFSMMCCAVTHLICYILVTHSDTESMTNTQKSNNKYLDSLTMPVPLFG